MPPRASHSSRPAGKHKSRKRAHEEESDVSPAAGGSSSAAAVNGSSSVDTSHSRLGYDPVAPDDHKSHAVVYRYRLQKNDDLATAIPRENVLDFFYPHSLQAGGAKKPKLDLDWLQQRRDVFLLAFEAVLQLPANDKWSYFQIAGIHGLPHTPYDGDEGVWSPSSEWWGGYCQHGSPLFPTWHRPYMMLLEQSIIRQARSLAGTFSDAGEKKVVEDIAEKLRIPFWDWADDTTRTLGLPDVFTSTQISLAYNWKSISRRRIPNPLKSFVLPEDVGQPVASSDVFNPSAKPNYVVPSEGTPFIPLGYPTVRHVDAAYTSQNDQLNVTLMRNSATTLVEGVHAMFHHDDWLSFSNHFWSKETHGDGSQYGHYSSLELVHDIVHGTVGGSGGQMTYPETAAFDPIFFFHHSNVDRLIALWQFCYPKSWIPDKSLQLDHDGTYTLKPESAVNDDTDLTPFRRSQKGESFVSSTDVRVVDVDCGYSYPEILRARKESWSPSKMLSYVLKMYRPPQQFVNRWILVMENILKRAFNGPYSIRVFLDKPDASASTPVNSPNFAGEIHVFARSNNVRCANCDKRRFMRASLDLTKTMMRLGITTAVELTGDSNIQETPSTNPLSEAGSIRVVLVDPTGNQLDPDSIANWEGPKLTLYFQEGVRDEEINESLEQQVDTQGAQLPRKQVHKFNL